MNERSELVVFVALALVGAGIFAAVGTTASMDLPVAHGTDDARETAGAFLRSHGYDVSGYTVTAVFEHNAGTGIYLQRTLPPGRARRAAREHSVYVWEVRFYRPLNQTEFSVDVDPVTGEVVGFRRHVPDGAAGDRLPTAAARERARSFLADRGYDLSAYEPIRNTSSDHPNRRDHVFAWRKRGGGVADAPVEVTVEIQGGRVGSYSERLDVPDGFEHQFEVTQNRNELLGTVASLVSVLLALIAIGFGVRYYRRGEFDARAALGVGILVGGILVGQRLNGLPGTLHRVPTTTTPLRYLAQVVIGGLIAAVVVGAVAGALFGAARRLADDYLGKPLLGDADPAAAVRTLKYSTLRGFCAGWILLGYVTLFYWLGARYLDVWLPVGTPYTGAMSTVLPAFAVLVVGVLPAVFEELTFRAVGISLGSRYLRSGAVAVVLTAAVWAFGHSQYVVLPAYARFVELTIAGVVLGWLFLRYDLVTVLAAHFTINASLTAAPMLLADLPFVVANGALGMALASLPLLVSVGTIGYDRLRPGRLEERLAPETVDPDAVRELLASTDEHVLTTAEVAAALDVPEDVAGDALAALAEDGAIEGKSVDGGAVWWA